MKIHLVNKIDKVEDYSKSPHIVKAIKEKMWSVCQLIASGHITENINEATCLACLRKGVPNASINNR